MPEGLSFSGLFPCPHESMHAPLIAEFLFYVSVGTSPELFLKIKFNKIKTSNAWIFVF